MGVPLFGSYAHLDSFIDRLIGRIRSSGRCGLICMRQFSTITRFTAAHVCRSVFGLFNARGRCWHRAPKIALSSSGLRRPNLVNSESSGCPAPQASARHTRHILPRSTPPAPPRPTHTRTLPLTSQATPFPSPPAPPQRQSRDANRQSATNMQRKRPCI